MSQIMKLSSRMFNVQCTTVLRVNQYWHVYLAALHIFFVCVFYLFILDLHRTIRQCF